MHTPIINIQEVHELARRLPESRGKAQLMAVKLPYPKQRLIFKRGTLIYLIELVRFFDGFVTFNGDAVNEELKISAAIYLFIDKTKVRYIGYVMLFNNTEFGDHAKPRVH